MWSLQDAKNKFSALVEAAIAGQPQEVTRRGQPAVVVISHDEYARLIKAAGAHRGRFVDHLMAFPAAEIERVDVKPRDVAF